MYIVTELVARRFNGTVECVVSHRTVVNWQNYFKDLSDKHIKNKIPLLILSKKCEYDYLKIQHLASPDGIILFAT